jgi:hypothetical protein
MSSAPPYAACVLVIAGVVQRGLQQQFGELAELVQRGDGEGVPSRFGLKLGLLLGPFAAAAVDRGGGLFGAGTAAEVRPGAAPADPGGSVEIPGTAALHPSHVPPPCGCAASAPQWILPQQSLAPQATVIRQSEGA